MSCNQHRQLRRILTSPFCLGRGSQLTNCLHPLPSPSHKCANGLYVELLEVAVAVDEGTVVNGVVLYVGVLEGRENNVE